MAKVVVAGPKGIRLVLHPNGRYDLFLRGGYNQKRLSADDVAAIGAMCAHATAPPATPEPPAPPEPPAT